MKRLIAEGVRVQMACTSPPYWGLRSYGIGTDNGELGLEPTPEQYVANLVEVFRLVRELLADDGVLWLNLGDSYSLGVGSARGLPYKWHSPQKSGLWKGTRSEKRDIGNNGSQKDCGELKPKDLIGIPWRVAFALQADGWWLRQDIIWSKPNPMPESVTDRCTKSHEYIFLLSKRERYYYDADAIRQESTGRTDPITSFGKVETRGDNDRAYDLDALKGANRRSVWTVTTQPYADAHFATFPPALIEPCILAGSRPGDTVLDPFFGSGTVGEVCQNLGRQWIGIELNEKYKPLQDHRTAQMGMVFL